MAKERYLNVRKTNFTQVSNGMLWNQELSLEAKGLLSIFLSNSDSWELNMKEIITRSKNGRDKHYNVVKELITNGYFARIEIREGGKFKEIIYIFSDNKEDVTESLKQFAIDGKESEKIQGIKESFPIPENPYTEKPYTTNPYINNTKINHIKKKNINDDEDIAKQASQTVSVHNPKLTEDDLHWITNKVREIYNKKIQKRSFDAVAKKCINNYKKGTVPHYENYLITAIENKIEELALRKEKHSLDLIPKTNKKIQRRELVPDWLHEQKDFNPIEQQGHTIDSEIERQKLAEILQKYKH